MTLFIACLIIYGLHLPGWLYGVAGVIWFYHMATTLNSKH
jgi:hypothetical protein